MLVFVYFVEYMDEIEQLWRKIEKKYEAEGSILSVLVVRLYNVVYWCQSVQQIIVRRGDSGGSAVE